MYTDLEGKVAIVTGAGRRKGLGEAMASRLAAEGCEVVIADLGAAQGEQMPDEAIGNTAEMEAVVEDIKAAGGKAHAFPCNMLEEQQVEQAGGSDCRSCRTSGYCGQQCGNRVSDEQAG